LNIARKFAHESPLGVGRTVVQRRERLSLAAVGGIARLLALISAISLVLAIGFSRIYLGVH
jgi:hypothetical protein